MEVIATNHRKLKIVATTAERELVRRSMAGDNRAQYGLYRKYVKAMYHTVLRMVGKAADAEDVTQEVFSKVFANLESFKGNSTLGAWIKQIAVNTALNFLRKEQRIRWVDLENSPELSVEFVPMPEVDATDLKRIHGAIKVLPEGCRVVFCLFLLEGYQHQEIAGILGISESTSKTQYRRARGLLQEALG
ncbi:MAG: RNA polymerase sigma factor (sigma-70 family) [Paraglaciecola sp.]